MSAGRAVFVTGGTGFVGSALVRRLSRIGHAVHVLARASSDRRSLEHLPITWHEGDLLDAPSVARALGRASDSAHASVRELVVVHSAALISYRTRDAALSQRVNVDGTRHVLDAARASGAQRLCFVSSVVTVGQAAGPEDTLDEQSRFNGEGLGCAYVTTKRAAEELVLASSRDLDVVVVNPGAIFGPAAVPSNTARFLAHVATAPRLIPSPPGSLSVVGVEDVADGIVRALDHGRSGRRYLLTESNWRVADIAALVREELGQRKSSLTLPRPLWLGAAYAARLVDRIRPLAVTTPQALRLLGEHYRFDARRARSELGWNPKPFAEVLKGTLSWMRSERFLR